MRLLTAARALLLGAATICALTALTATASEVETAAAAEDIEDAQSASTAVWLATIAPGEEYWARFGHNALILVPEADDRAISYNFGYFDFTQPHFLRRFLRGRVYYQSLALLASRDLPGYASENRSVYLQSLAMTPTQAWRLHTELERSMRPEHRDYLYDYFTANCSTRLRDALDLAMDGELRRQTSGRSRGYTYRMHALRLAEGNFWLGQGIDLGLGPYADRPLSFWQEMFIPELMRRHLREVQHPDGSALVAAESIWFDSGQSAPPELPRNRLQSFALTGLALAALILWLSGHAHGRRAQADPARRSRRNADRVLRGLGSSLQLLFGLSGLVLLLLWLATDHIAAHGNENLLLLSPLSLLLAPLWLRRRRGRFATVLAVVIAVGAGFALVSKTIPDYFTQANLHWCLLLLPLHLALLHAWLRRPGSRNP